jgi:homoserine dehydrogenase
VRPAQVRRRGIAGLTGLDARRAVRAGTRLRLVVRGVRQGGRVRVSVAPERIPLGDPLSGSGPDAALVLETDLMGEIGVFERGATVDQTAYALLSDLLEIVSLSPRGTPAGRVPRGLPAGRRIPRRPARRSSSE